MSAPDNTGPRRKGKSQLLPGLLLGLLLLVGLSILLYPTISDRIAARHHSKAIVEYAVTVEELTRQELDSHFSRARGYNGSLTGLVTGDAFDLAENGGATEEYLAIMNIGGMIGYVDIPAIGVHLPVYHTVAEPVLRRGVGHMPETAFPVGRGGDHPVLTAHRGLPSAKLFTDLNRLEVGDLFELHILDQVFRYQVDQVLVVEPHDTEALQPIPGEDKVTLVTCTPYAINSHRMLVRGGRVPDDATRPDADNTAPAVAAGGFPPGAAVFLVIALVLGGLLAFCRSARRRNKGR